MKMELAMTAPMDGLVAELSVAVGDKVVVDQPLARVEANGPMTVLRTYRQPGLRGVPANLSARTRR